MKKLYYQITALEPLIITQNSDDPNMYETLQYIRGTVIQGLFAQMFLKETDPNMVKFNELIVKGGCNFLNAYPSIDSFDFFPTPYSMIRLKYPEKKDNVTNENVAFDLLNVNDFDKQTKSLGLMISLLKEMNEIKTFALPTEIRLHNQINDKNRTSEKGILFNYQSLPAGSVFKGYLVLKNDADEILLKTLVNDTKSIRIGRSATAEYGKIEFKWIDYDGIPTKVNSTGQVILTLLSDTLIFNKNGFSSLDVADIEQYLKDTKVIKSISRKNRIEGFLNIWKLRKPSENVFAAGSSFLLDKMPDNADELFNTGLGERTVEGYGQVSFSFQDAGIKSYNFEKFRKVSKEKPVLIPDLAKAIWANSLINQKKNEIANKALTDANNTRPRVESNHLIGRLKDMSLNIAEFKNNIGELRKQAKSHLEKSFIGNLNLEEHIKFILDNNFPVNLPEEIELSVIVQDDLKKLYFETYFTQLRRINIKKEQR